MRFLAPRPEPMVIVACHLPEGSWRTAPAEGLTLLIIGNRHYGSEWERIGSESPVVAASGDPCDLA